MIADCLIQSIVWKSLLPGVRTSRSRPLRFDMVKSQRLCSSSEGGNAKEKSKPPHLTLCQVNNHPSYRLKRAKGRLEAISTAGKTSISRKPKLTKTYNTPRLEKPPTFVKYYNVVQEHGIAVLSNENPARSNDGTSSGAIAEDRLRTARKRALESMARSSRDSTIEQSDFGLGIDGSNHLYLNKPVRENGLNILAYENPVRSSDGTSSGAVAADRLRTARRKALESMSKPSCDSNADSKSDLAVKERGLDVLAYENPVRSNDGTSSGAIAADRLREARRRALEGMSKPMQERKAE